MDSSSQCTICIEELVSDLTAAPCGHVFHTVCIDKWKSIHPSCPICKAPTPDDLLRLFFTVDHTCQPKYPLASASAVQGNAMATGDVKDADASPADPEDVARLKVEVAANSRVLKMSAEAIEGYKDEIRNLSEMLRDTKADAAVARHALETQLEEMQAKLETTRIDLSKKHKEWFQLKREINTKQKQLESYKSERRTNEYIAQFAARKSRVLNSLGQVSVESVIEDIARGATRAEDIIRGQHELLTQNVDQQQKALLSLRKSREECASAVEGLSAARLECQVAKRKARQLERCLSRSRAGSQVSDGYPKSADSLVEGGDRMQVLETEGDSAQRRRRRNGGPIFQRGEDGIDYISLDDDEEDEQDDDSSPEPKRRKTTSRNEGSSHSDLAHSHGGGTLSTGENDTPDEANLGKALKEGIAAEGRVAGLLRARSRELPSAAGPTRLEKALGIGVRGPAFINSRSVVSSSLTARRQGKSHASQGKYIRTGYDALGGSHSVAISSLRRLPNALQRKESKGSSGRS